MKILLTTDTVGGVWVYALELARELSRRGVEVTLATMGAPLNEEQQREAEAVPSLQVYESSYKLEWMENPWEDVAKAGRWLLELADRAEVDVVHLNGYAHANLPWHRPTLVVGHSCVLSWWLSVKGEEAPSAWDRYRDEVKAGLEAADLVVTPTKAMLDALEHHYGELKHKGVIYNGRDPEQFPPADDKKPYIFAAGRLWDEAKNIRSLVEVAPRMAWPIYVAGEDQHPEGGAAEVAHLHPIGRLGQSELAKWYSEASIYALPARYEPFGLSALEAGMAGNALVLGDIPSLREVWQESAMFVPPDDSEALLATLNALIMDAPLRQEYARRARERSKTFTAARMADGYLATYQRLMENKDEV